MANPNAEQYIEHMIRYPFELIVCGVAAQSNRAVRLYRWKKRLTVVASALTGIGVVSPILNAIQEQETNLPNLLKEFTGLPLLFTVVGVALFAVAWKFYESGDVEKKAILALALSESYKRLKTELENKLPYSDPRNQLPSVQEAATALQRLSEIDLMPEPAQHRDEIDREWGLLIARFSPRWDPALRAPQLPIEAERR